MKIIDINGNTRDCVKAFPDPSYPGYMRVEFKTAVRSHHVWYPIEDFIKNNPELESLTKSAPAIIDEVVGVVSSCTDMTLSDKKQKLKVNAYVGVPIWISRGTGEGQIRNVTGNTHNTITVDKKWDIKPDKTSQYVLSHNIHDPQPLQNILPN